MEEIFEFIFKGVLGTLFKIVFIVIIAPVMLIVSTPFIFIGAFFYGLASYWDTVKKGYERVLSFSGSVIGHAL